MDNACPACGAHDVRLAHSQGFSEHALELVGVYPIRCKRCQMRFRRRLWNFSQVKYARCPRCYRTELSTWSEQYYNPPFSVKLKLRLGATPYRCEFCRCNFASFRACQERFSWRKHRRQPDSNHPHPEPGVQA
jgi:hypothetical protein